MTSSIIKGKIRIIINAVTIIILLLYISLTVISINSTNVFYVKNNAATNGISSSNPSDISLSPPITNPFNSPTLFFTNTIIPSFTTVIKPIPLSSINTTNPNLKSIMVPKIKNLNLSTSSELQKLDEYQNVTGSFVTNKMMIFSYMPSDSDAKEVANDLSTKLKEFSKYNVTPIVIIEPVNSQNNFDPNKYINGDYDNAMNIYLARLNELGITDQQLGIMTPFPEINIPEWNGKNYSAETYTSVINKYIPAIRSVFPSAKTSLLLDSATVESWDLSNSATDYKSLLPYVKNIQKGLVNYFGLQGFSWIPEKGSSETPSLEPNNFLNTKQAKDAADGLGIKNIWFNTGTPFSLYSNDSSKASYLTADQRQVILKKIAEQTNTLKNSGYSVWINLFDEDKSNSSEAVDWSYWHSISDQNSHKEVFKNFLNLLNTYSIPISLYDHK